MLVSNFFLVVSGSRQFTNATLVHQHLQQALKKQPNLVVIAGCSKGIDQLAIAWAKQHFVPCIKLTAQWSRFGKAAGPKRNVRMLSMANGLLAFPLANSKGTVSIIKSAKKHQIPTKIVAS